MSLKKRTPHEVSFLFKSFDFKFHGSHIAASHHRGHKNSPPTRQNIILKGELSVVSFITLYKIILGKTRLAFSLVIRLSSDKLTFLISEISSAV